MFFSLNRFAEMQPADPIKFLIIYIAFYIASVVSSTTPYNVVANVTSTPVDQYSNDATLAANSTNDKNKDTTLEIISDLAGKKQFVIPYEQNTFYISASISIIPIGLRLLSTSFDEEHAL